MKRLYPLFLSSIVIILCLITAYGLGKFLSQYSMEPGNGALQIADIQEKIHIEIMSKDYLKNHEYLLKAEIDGELVGIVYFDKNGDIQFEGDKEKFEYALCKAFSLRIKKED